MFDFCAIFCVVYKTGALGDVNLHPHVVLGERCLPPHTEKEHRNWTKTLNCAAYPEQGGLKDLIKSVPEKTGRRVLLEQHDNIKG